MRTTEAVGKLKNILCCEIANCSTCAAFRHESDGEYGEIFCGYYCDNEDRPGNERLTNLKSFPFKKEQRCWQPDFWQTKFADEIDGTDETHDSAAYHFREALIETEGGTMKVFSLSEARDWFLSHSEGSIICITQNGSELPEKECSCYPDAEKFYAIAESRKGAK